MGRPIRHTLPPELESGLFGSPLNGDCSSISGVNNEICDGISVLNDGIIPALSVVNDPASQWANELFTMRRSETGQIKVSVEVSSGLRNRMELTVFNCPLMGISAPQINLFIGDSLALNSINLNLIVNKTLTTTSCDHLLKFCVQFGGAVGAPILNLVFPSQNNSNFVFLGEVVFSNDPSQCDPPELINMTATPQPSTIG